MGRMGEFMEKLTNPVLDYLEVLEGKNFDEMLDLAFLTSDISLFRVILDYCENIDYDKFSSAAIKGLTDEKICELVEYMDGHAEKLIGYLLSGNIEKSARFVFGCNSEQMKKVFAEKLLKSDDFNSSTYIVKLLKEDNEVDKDSLARRLASIGLDREIADAIINGKGFDKTSLLKSAIKSFSLDYWNNNVVKSIVNSDITYDMVVDLLLSSKDGKDIDEKILEFAKVFGGSKKIEDYFIEKFDIELLVRYCECSNVDISRIENKILALYANNDLILDFVEKVPNLDLKIYLRHMIEKHDAKAALKIFLLGDKVGEKFDEDLIYDAAHLAVEQKLSVQYLNQVHPKLYFIPWYQQCLVNSIIGGDYDLYSIIKAFKSKGLEYASYEMLLNKIAEKATALELVELYNQTSKSHYDVWKNYNITSFIWTYADYHNTSLVYDILTKNEENMPYEQKLSLIELIVSGENVNLIFTIFKNLKLDFKDLKYQFRSACEKICEALIPDYILEYAYLCEKYEQTDLHDKLVDALIKTGNIDAMIKLMRKIINLSSVSVAKIEDYVLSTKKKDIIINFFVECFNCINDIDVDKFYEYINKSKISVKEKCAIISRIGASNIDIIKLVTNPDDLSYIVNYLVETKARILLYDFSNLEEKATEYIDVSSLYKLTYVCENMLGENVNGLRNNAIAFAATFASAEDLLIFFGNESIDKIYLANKIIDTGDIHAIARVIRKMMSAKQMLEGCSFLEEVILATENAELIYELYTLIAADLNKTDEANLLSPDKYARAILDTKDAEYIARFFSNANSELVIKYVSELKEYADAMNSIKTYKRGHREIVDGVECYRFISFVRCCEFDVFEAMYNGENYDKEYLNELFVLKDKENIDMLVEQVDNLRKYINTLYPNGDETPSFDENDFIRISRESGYLDKFVDVFSKTNPYYTEDFQDILIKKYYLEGKQKLRKLPSAKKKGKK